MTPEAKHGLVTGGSRGIGRGIVALLCSPDAGWITGRLIHADGGASLVDTALPLDIRRGSRG
jgi:NAD(P)-dependent dehydrogenase (short-subunit alcohol dehydrogenase family)